MNKNFKYIIAAFGVLLLGLSSCSDRLSEAVVKENVTVEDGTDILSFNLEEVSSTKLTLNEDGANYQQFWTKNDAISVIGTGHAKFTLKEESAGTTRGIFTGSYKSAGERPYHIVFPYDENAAVSGGAVHFAIPQVKTGVANNVAPGAMPCVALAGDTEDGTPEIKNVMGLLRLTLKSESGVKVSKMTLHDLGGNMLWGDCSVPIEEDALAVGKMTLSGGDNSISLVWADNEGAEINSTGSSFFFPVPPGSLDRGFSIVIYDNTGKAYTFIQKVSSPIAAERAKAVAINSSTLSEKSEPKDPKARGYYKSLFVDAGLYLNPRYFAENPPSNLSVIPAIKALGLENDYEYFAATPTSFQSEFQKMLETNTKAQRSIFVGTPLSGGGFEGISWNDANGVLLYPDGSPRFRMMYSNGGKSGDHGKSMTEEGCFRVHDFYTNGGSYAGTCAGTIIACTSYNGDVRYKGPDGTYSYGIWPGNAEPTGMPYTLDLDPVYTGMKVTSGVLADYGFNQNGFINDFEHHGGCYLPDGSPYPHEQLLTYQYNKDEGSDKDKEHRYKPENSSKTWFRYNGTGSFINIVDYVSTWVYKANNTSGRAFLCGSHPEKETVGDKLEFTKAMFLYAMEGSGDAKVKEGDLMLGDIRVMDKSTEDNQPDYTKIGDGQYHHFKLTSSGIKDFQLVLSSNYASDSGINLYLSLRKGGLAWLSDADYAICTKGSNKILNIKNLPAGEWYVGVYCATKVTATAATTSTAGVESQYPRYFKYSGKTDVLDGIPYTISISSGDNTVPSYPAVPFDDNFSLDD